MTSQKVRLGASPRVETYRVKLPSKGPGRKAKPLIYNKNRRSSGSTQTATIMRFEAMGNARNREPRDRCAEMAHGEPCPRGAGAPERRRKSYRLLEESVGNAGCPMRPQPRVRLRGMRPEYSRRR